jgi:hypothetical protein
MMKIGRNDPCPCGSGKKYKKCCWEKDEAAAHASTVTAETAAEAAAAAEDHPHPGGHKHAGANLPAGASVPRPKAVPPQRPAVRRRAGGGG